jgi:tetrahydromethanopterin S-methyltransferase subunit G
MIKQLLYVVLGKVAIINDRTRRMIMAKAENTKNEEQESTEQPESKSEFTFDRNYVIAGSAIGAGIGYLSSSRNRTASGGVLKKVLQSEAARSLSFQIGRTVQDIVLDQVRSNLQEQVTSYLEPKQIGSVVSKKLIDAGKEKFSGGKDSNETSSAGSDELEKVKKENDELKERLEKMENMLNKLSDSSSN